MKISELTSFLESLAPLPYQEDYDNSGLIVGDPAVEISSAIISLDCTEAVVDEAIKRGCKLIISHHPIVFRGLKKFNGKTYVERVVMKAIKHDIALYAIHTNLDAVDKGVNRRICDLLGIKNPVALRPKADILNKLVTFCPVDHVGAVREALFQAGAGHIGKYSNCSFNTVGSGTFQAGQGASPFVGEINKMHTEEEVRVEVIFPHHLERRILSALFLSHPYEEVAYDIYRLENSTNTIGSGMVGDLEVDMNEVDFLTMVRDVMNCRVVRHTSLLGKKVRRVAVCGGSGSFLLQDAIRAGADVFVTADFKYHEFFDADNKVVIADIGHFESEQFTQHLLMELIQEKFPNFALHLTLENTNPINYLI